MIITYKYKLYNHKRNKHITQQLRIACNVYNHCIALHRRYYRMFKRHLDINKLQRHITKLKRRTHQFWCALNSQTIQDITDRIDRAYKLFYRNRKRGIKSAPPKFRSFRKYRSITFKQTGYKLLDGNAIKIMDRTYKFHKSRELAEGIVKTMTVKRDACNDYYIYFTIDTGDVFKPLKPMTGNVAGFDAGLKTFLISSEGDKIISPQFFFSEIARMRKLSKQLSKKVKGSNNRKRARAELARLHRQITNKRRDWFFKLSIQLADKYDALIFEDLNLKAMQQLWGRKISDLAFAEYFGIQQYICAKRGTRFIQNDRFERSTTICSVCGAYNPNLTLKDRAWTCNECGTQHDRDENAAKNIKRVGMSTLGVEAIIPA